MAVVLVVGASRRAVLSACADCSRGRVAAPVVFVFCFLFFFSPSWSSLSKVTMTAVPWAASKDCSPSFSQP